MSIRCNTPCDYGECPYDAQYSHDCEYWCGAEEPADDCEEYEEETYDLDTPVITVVEDLGCKCLSLVDIDDNKYLIRPCGISLSALMNDDPNDPTWKDGCVWLTGTVSYINADGLARGAWYDERVPLLHDERGYYCLAPLRSGEYIRVPVLDAWDEYVKED